MKTIHTSHVRSSDPSSEANSKRTKRFGALTLVPFVAMMALLLLFWHLDPITLFAQTGTIRYAAPNGSGTTCSQANPCALQTAVDISTNGAEIRAARGNYPSLRISTSITILGSFITPTWSVRDPEFNPSNISGGNNTNAIWIENNITPADANPVIDGFHIINGAASDGAGIHVESGNPTIQNNWIHDNVASAQGGAIFVDNGDSATIQNNHIYDNQAGAGAGILVSFGGADVNLLFNEIHDNQASGNGGGFILVGGSTAFVEGNEIYGNSANNGGGLYIEGAADKQNNMIFDNTATAAGGGAYLAPGGTLNSWNNTFAGNHAAGNGGGIHTFIGTLQISNTIVVSNTSGSGMSGINVTGGTAVTGDYNNIFGNSSDFNATNDVNADPVFISLALWNLHLSQSSPLIDRGDPATSPTINQDIDQQARPNPDGTDPTRVDIGADEFYASIPEFSLTPIFRESFEDRGTAITVEHWLENLNTTDADTYLFDCTNDQGWDIACPSDQPLGVGQAISVSTQITIPGGESALTAGLTIITATSTISTELKHAVAVRTIVRPNPGLQFTANISRTAAPGEIITLTHTLTNTGDAPDVFHITIDSDTFDWVDIIPQEPLTVPLGINASRNIRVRVTVPEYAAAIIPNVAQIRATSSYDVDTFALVTDTVRALETLGTRFVSNHGDGDDFNNNCTQASRPCATVPHAIEQAVTNDEVRVVWSNNEYPVNDEIQINETIHLSGRWLPGFVEQDDELYTIIRGDGDSRIFALTGAANTSTFNGITIIDGDNAAGRGGAINIGANVQATFDKVTIQSSNANRGGAVNIETNGFARFIMSHFISNTASLNGGAIHVDGGTLIIQQSDFRENSVSGGTTPNGGALYVDDSLLISENTLYALNTAVQNGSNGGDGGALYVNGSDITINHNTFAENSADDQGGALYFNNSSQPASIVNSLFSDNNAAAGEAIFANAGTIDTDFINYSNNTNAGGGTINETADIYTFPPAYADTDYRLSATSQIVDLRGRNDGDPSDELDFDFEDDNRPADEGYDLGYDELAGCSVKRDETIYGSIQEAIDDPAGIGSLLQVSGICRGVHDLDIGGSTIQQTVHLTGSQEFIIQGGWDGEFERQHVDETTIVDPQGLGRAFYVSGSVTVTLEYLTLMNGNATGLQGGPANEDAGGIFYNDGGLVILNAVSLLTGTADIGAAYFNRNGRTETGLITAAEPDFNVTPDDAEIVLLGEARANTAASDGGAFYIYSGTVAIDSMEIFSNTAVNGTGIYNEMGVVTATNTVLAFNDATGNGAGIYNRSPMSTTLLHLTLYDNVANGNGGGIFVESGSPTAVRSNIFEANQAASGTGLHAPNSISNDYNYFYNQTIAGGVTLGSNSTSTSLVPPGLIDPANGNFHLQNTAAAADTGDPNSPVDHDFDDDPRPSNQGPDAGADEVAGCRAELNGTIYGSIQEAMENAQAGDTIRVAGICSGVHDFDTGGPAGDCRGEAGDNGTIQTTVHVDENVILQGGWDQEFTTQDQDITILDANNLGRVIYIAPGITATVENFHIMNGNINNGAGICIDNAAPTIQNNVLISNTATNNGGAIYAVNSNGRIDGNRIHNSTALADGAGLYVTAGELSIWNNFIYSNTADTNGGGFFSDSGDHLFWHNTLVGNEASTQGAGVYVNADSPQIRNTVFLNNSSPAVDGIYGQTGSTPVIDFNDYFGQSSNAGGTAAAGSNSIFEDPLFTTSAYTLTFASPLVDVGDPTMTLTHDFEDDIRLSHLGFDIGADEIGGCVARNLADPTTIYGSLQLAVDEATDGDTIEVDGVCRNAKTHPDGGGTQNLFVDKELTIDGDWVSQLVPNTNFTATLDALSRGRVVFVDNTAVLTLTNIQLVNGDANGAGINNHGGGIYNEGTLLLQEADVMASTAVNGGGIYNAADITLQESHVRFNDAQNGGGFYNATAGTATLIEGNHFAQNVVSSSGGGVYQNAGTLLLDGNKIYENIASSGNGGGIMLASGSSANVHVRNNFVYRNLAQAGGGLYNQIANNGIWHNTFYRNTAAANNGGGIYSSVNAVIHSNIVDSSLGSGIHTTGAADIDYNNVVDNLANDVPADYSGTAAANAGPDEISIPPSYIDPAADNYHLESDSAGVDDGDPNLNFDNDYDGDLRPTNGGPDRGADEINSCLIRVINPNTGEENIFGVLQDAIDEAEDLFNGSLPIVEIARGECSGVKLDDQTNTYQVGIIREDLVFEGSLRRSDFQYVGDYTSDEVDTVSSVINALGDGRVIYIHDGADPYFNHLAFVQGDATQSGDPSQVGGGMYIDATGSAQLEESFICDSQAVDGGGLYIPATSSPPPGETNYVSGVTIGACITAFIDEDPIDGSVDEGDVTYHFHAGNTATGEGGGAYAAGEFQVRNTGFLGNVAGDNGGGLYNSSSNTLVINGIFFANTTAASGGGIYNTGSSMEIYHATVRDNLANGGNGGGVRNEGSSFIVNSSIFYANEASGTGGGVSSGTGATLAYNSYYNNLPNNSDTGGTGSNSQIIEADDLNGIFPAIDSPVIDTADPLLLDPGPASYGLPINFDADNLTRPDGGTIHLGNMASDRGAFEWHKDFGCTVTPTPQQATLSPGNNSVYHFTVTNTGWPLPPTDYANGFIDTITVTLHSSTSGWTTLQGGNEQVFVDMDWYESRPLTLTVQVPTDATTGMSDITQVRCQSESMPDRFSDGQATTNVGLVSGVIVYPSFNDAGVPGEVLPFTHTVENVGNEIGDFVIRPDAGDQFASAVLLDVDSNPITETFVTLAPNETFEIVLEATLLDTAVPGEFANPGVVAAEVGNEANNNGSVLNSILILNEPGTRHVALGGQDSTNCTDPTNPCGTIQWAVDVAYDADDVLVAEGVYVDTVTRTIGLEEYEQNIFIDKPITIRGGYTTDDDFSTQFPVSQTTRLDGEGTHRVIYVESGITVTLSSLFIENGNADNDGNPDLGGGIYNNGADLTITGTWVYSNSAQFGGGLYHAGGTLQSDSSVFAHNDTTNGAGIPGFGAGIYINDGTAVFENNTIVDNDTNTGDNNDGSTGGGIYVNDGFLTSLNNIFSQNAAEELGSAVYISTAVTVVTSNYNLYWNNDVNLITGTNSFIADPDFADSFFHIAATSPAKDAGAITRTLTATVDFDLQPRVMGTNIDIGADERLQRPNFTFTPISATQAITASTVYTYEFVLSNTGDSVDSYEIAMSNQSIPAGGNWSYTLPVTEVTDLALNTAVTITFGISGSNPGFVDHTILTASTTNLAEPIERSVQATTTITFSPGVDIEMSETGIGNPGNPTNYTHVLTNTGDGTDQFEIRITDVVTNPPLPGWTVSVNPTQTGFLAPNATMPFTVSVTPPAGAPPGSAHTVTVEALSLNMLGIEARDTLTDVTTVEEARGWLFIPDFQSQNPPDNTVVTFTHMLQNIGNVADSATLTVTGTPDTWALTIEPQNTPTLAPLASIPVTVTVTVPENTGGMTHTAVLTATSDNAPTAVGTAIDEINVQTFYDVIVEPDLTETMDVNTTVMFTHTITNNSNVADVYTITAQSTLTWTTFATPGPISLDPGMTDTITVTVLVPPDAVPDFPNTTTVTATSQSDPAVFDTAVDITRIRQQHSLLFEESETGTTDPGTDIVYTHWLTNTGNGTDRFGLTAVTTNNWVTAVPPEIELGPGVGTSLNVTLTVPTGAAGRTEVMTVTATSVISPSASAFVTDTTTVNGTIVPISVIIEPDNSDVGNPGETIQYTHTVTNNSAIIEDFVLTTLSENGWAAGVSPTNVNIRPFESAQIVVTTSIPASAPNNSTDVLTVTVTSQTDASANDNAQDTTTVGLSRGVIIEPDQSDSGSAGETVTYTHTLTNTGNAEDTFNITTESSNTWITPDPPQVTVGGALSTTVVVTLVIPAGAPTTTDVMTVTATSVNDATATDTAVDTINVTGVSGTRSVVIEPDNSDMGQPGDTVDYNHTITNTGTVTDDYRLSLSSTQGWTVVSTPGAGDVINLAPNQTANVTVRVTVPTNATVGTVDVTTITVESISDGTVSDIARDTTTAGDTQPSQPTIYLPVIMKPGSSGPNPTATPVTPTSAPPTATPCLPTTNVDLVVTQIQVVPGVPASGVEATVNVTIRNQGSTDVSFGNNFFVDFYVNRVPQPYLVGDIVWGVQGSDLTAGTSRTYSAPYIFGGGSHQLYAQVDTDQHVNECPNENNNVLGPVSLTVSGTAVSGHQEVVPQFGPRETPEPVPLEPESTPTSVLPSTTPTVPLVTLTGTPTQTAVATETAESAESTLSPSEPVVTPTPPLAAPTPTPSETPAP